MADMEVGGTAVSAASWESSECGTDGMDGGHAMMGGVAGESLPPRKRLLVGLRQNGWLSSSPPLVSRGVGGFSREVGQEEEDVVVDGEEGVEVVSGEQQEERVACHGLESTGMRRIKRRGVNCSTEARVAVTASTAVEFFNPSFKKPRMSRERPKLVDKDRANASKREQYKQTRDEREGSCAPKSRIFVPVRTGSQGMAIPLPSHDAVAAAKSAAAQAVKLAVAAKENAAAKASVAVKAAAAAKMALEAAAHAARAAAQAQAGLQRKATGSEPGFTENSAKMLVQPGNTKNLSPRVEVKVEKEDKQAECGVAVSVDDKELAREHHRTVNSSPGISHCLPLSVREVSFTAPDENSAELPFDAMVEADAVASHTDPDSHDGRPDFLQEILEAAVLADSAMSLDEGADAHVHEEVLQSECDGGAGLQESRSFSDLQVETKEVEPRSDDRLFDTAPSVATGPQILVHNVGIINAETFLEAPAASEMVNADDECVASKDSSEVVHSDHADMALEVSGAADIVDADDAAMDLKDSGAAEVLHPDYINMAVTHSGAAEMVVAADAGMHLKCFRPEVFGLEDAEIALKGPGTAEVVCADDADTVFKDSGTADMVHVDVPSRVTPVEGLEAGSEPLLVAQGDLVKANLKESAPVDV